MFWRREQTVRVELVNPEIRVKAECPSAPTAPTAAVEPSTRVDTDFAFKLASLSAVVLQAVLLIHGYSVLAGQYDLFGIDINELEIGLPTLIFNGYVSLLTDLYGAASRTRIVGPALLLGGFVLLAAIFVWPVMKAARSNSKLTASALLGFTLFIVFSLPMFGVIKGQKNALNDFKKQSGINSATSVQTEHSITTDQGEEKRGMIIVASAKYTFMLSGTDVFKIDNDGNKVVRVTRLSAKSDPAETTKP